VIAEAQSTTKIAAFDHEPETALTELTIRELISTYPDNQDVRHVLVKVNLIRLKESRVKFQKSTVSSMKGKQKSSWASSAHQTDLHRWS
jgi:hypothetical protein